MSSSKSLDTENETNIRIFAQIVLLAVTKLTTFASLYIYSNFLDTSSIAAYVYLQAMVVGFVAVASLQLPAAFFRFTIDFKYRSISSYITRHSRYLIYAVTFLAFFVLLREFDTPWLAVIISFTQIIGLMRLEILRALDSRSNYYKLQFLQVIATLIVVSLFLSRFSDYDYFLYVYAAAEILSWLMVCFFSGRLLNNNYLLDYAGIEFSWPLFKNIVGYGVALVPTSLSWWVITQSPLIIASEFLGEIESATYAIANRVPSVVSLVAFLILGAMSRKLSLKYELDPRAFKLFFLRIISAWSLFFGVLSFVAYHANSIILNHWYADYTPSTYVQLFLVINTFLISIFSFSGFAYVATKKAALSSISTMIAAFVGVGLGLFFSERYGLLGLPCGMSAGLVIGLGFRLINIWRLPFESVDQKLLEKNLS